MSFLDDMKKLSQKAEEDAAHRDDREIEQCLTRMKAIIKSRIARGEKVVSQDDWLCFATKRGQSDHVAFSVRMGLVQAVIHWSMTQKLKDKLEALTRAAAREGIEITRYSFILGNGSGDDDRSYDGTRFYEDNGVLQIPRTYCKPYLNTIKDPEEWYLLVDCSFRFSL